MATTNCRHGYFRLDCGECSTFGERMAVREQAYRDYSHSHGVRSLMVRGTSIETDDQRAYHEQEMEILERRHGPRGSS